MNKKELMLTATQSLFIFSGESESINCITGDTIYNKNKLARIASNVCESNDNVVIEIINNRNTPVLGRCESSLQIIDINKIQSHAINNGLIIHDDILDAKILDHLDVKLDVTSISRGDRIEVSGPIIIKIGLAFFQFTLTEPMSFIFVGGDIVNNKLVYKADNGNYEIILCKESKIEKINEAAIMHSICKLASLINTTYGATSSPNSIFSTEDLTHLIEIRKKLKNKLK